MPSSHCTILARFFTRRQVLMNRRQMPDIWGKSVLVHASDNHVVWIIKDAIWENRWWVADTWEIFGMLNIWSCWRFTILLCEWVLTENYIGDDLQPTWPTWESKKQGSWKLGEDFFYCKAIYKKRAYILPLEYTDYGYTKLQKGLGFFLWIIFFYKGQKMYCIFIFHHFDGFYRL